MSKITLTLTFESDWHVGEGAGSLGHIDRIVRRDPEDKLPYVPGKTLTGILRDGCEKVAYGLDNGNEGGGWQRFLCGIFGEQSQGTNNIATTTNARLDIDSARLDPSLRSALANSAELKAALTFVKTGIKIDEDGIAVSKKLRYEEVVLAGAELYAEAKLELPDGVTRQAALALLAAGAKAVGRLGAKRRRGNGRCVLEIADSPDNLAEILSQYPPILPPYILPALELKAAQTGTDETGWHVINLDLELLTPVVIPADTSGNVISTRDHIPGSLLLPALDKKLRVLLGAQTAPSLTTLLARGYIQIRNAYPLVDSIRLLPVPASLMAEKDNPGTIVNELYRHTDDGKQRKQLRDGYTPSTGLPTSNSDKAPLVMVKTVAATHAVIEDKTQRPTSGVGGVYTYEAIRAKQTLRAELWIAKSVLAPQHDLAGLDGEVRIGRAKKGDYGRVKIAASLGAAGSANAASTKIFTLWLTSPLLVRDERLRPITDTEAFAAWLGKRLNVVLPPKNINAFVRSFRDDGWNNAWKEPRPTRFGLAAGSCFYFMADKEIDGNLLSALEAEGLGERRGEGYGEVRVNPPILEQSGIPRIELTSALKIEPANAVGSPQQNQKLESTEFTRQLQQRAWRIAIRRQAVTNAGAIANCLGWQEAKPENSQLGALRSVFESWRGTGADRNRLRDWLKHLREIPKRKDKWPDKSLAELESFAAGEDAVWSRIQVSDLPLIPGHNLAEAKRSMSAEATRILWLTTIAVVFDKRAVNKQDSTQPAVEN